MTAVDAEWEPAMRFVVVTSAGGPYDDDAYVAGYEASRLDTILTLTSDVTGVVNRLPATVRTDNLPQVDLIAMRHGLVMVREEDHEGGWTTVALMRSP